MFPLWLIKQGPGTRLGPSNHSLPTTASTTIGISAHDGTTVTITNIDANRLHVAVPKPVIYSLPQSSTVITYSNF